MNQEEMYRQQQQPGLQTQFFPGFPGLPGIDLVQRVRFLEAEVVRLQRQIDILDRRVRRLETGGGFFPYPY